MKASEEAMLLIVYEEGKKSNASIYQLGYQTLTDTEERWLRARLPTCLRLELVPTFCDKHVKDLFARQFLPS